MKIEEKDSPSKNDQIEEYLSALYEFRYNTVLHRAEYRPRGEGGYTSVDRYRINTLKRGLDKEANIQTSTDNLYSIIESDFTNTSVISIKNIKESFSELAREVNKELLSSSSALSNQIGIEDPVNSLYLSISKSTC